MAFQMKFEGAGMQHVGPEFCEFLVVVGVVESVAVAFVGFVVVGRSAESFVPLFEIPAGLD